MELNSHSHYRAAQKAEIAERRARVSDMYLKKGWTVRRIAKEMGCSIGTVSEDMQALIAGWQNEASANMRAHIATMLKAIDEDTERALDAYERSRKVKRVASVTKSDGVMGPSSTATATQIERDEGDMRALAIVAKCREMRMKVLGMGVAQEQDKKETGKTATTIEDFIAQHHEQKQLNAESNALKQLPPHE